MNNFGEKIVDIGYFIAAPTIMLTENSTKKWKRLLGVFAVFLLFPLVFIGMIVIMVGLMINMIDEI